MHIFFIIFLYLVNRSGQICNAHQTQNFENEACEAAEHQHKPNLATNIICLLIRSKCNLPLVEKLLAKCIFVQLYHILPLSVTICYW